MRFLRHSFAGLLLVAVAAGLILFAVAQIKGAVDARMAKKARVPEVRERVLAVNVVTAEPQTVTPTMTAFGSISSTRTLDVRAAAAGTVIELAPEFTEGGKVQAGQLLVQIDPTNAQAALDRAKTDLLDANAEVNEAKRALELAKETFAAAKEQSTLRTRAAERQKDLKARKVGTDAAVETAELAASGARQAMIASRQSVAGAEARNDQAQTRLERARLAVDDAQRKVSDTTIQAQFSGTLSGVTLVQGGLVSVNERLAQLISPDSLEVSFRLSTAQYSRLLDDKNQLPPLPVKATLDAFGAEISANGTIAREAAAVGDGQTGRVVFARLDSASGLRPGDFVTVSITENPVEFVVQLPATAVSADNQVLVLGEEDRLEEVAVNVVRRIGDDVLLRSPDIRGRDVVIERSPLLGKGIKVKPLRGPVTVSQEEPETVELTAERREKLIAFVEQNGFMPKDIKTRILNELAKDKVSAKTVERLEKRMGG